LLRKKTKILAVLDREIEKVLISADV
jgi:hypothetical protein